jgi:hypothetical protein
MLMHIFNAWLNIDRSVILTVKEVMGKLLLFQRIFSLFVQNKTFFSIIYCFFYFLSEDSFKNAECENFISLTVQFFYLPNSY